MVKGKRRVGLRIKAVSFESRLRGHSVHLDLQVFPLAKKQSCSQFLSAINFFQPRFEEDFYPMNLAVPRDLENCRPCLFSVSGESG